MARRVTSLVLLTALTALLPACGSSAAQSTKSATMQSVTVGMGYVPDVQFAPFYMAESMGLYRKAGVNVHFDYAFSPNLLQLTAVGHDQFSIADATDTITGVANGYRVKNVASIYQRLPVAVFSLARKHITSISALRGKTVGIPGKFGSTYVALLAALHRDGISASSLTLRSIGYAQAASVVAGKVDAAVGYSNNEPVLLKREGYSVAVQEIGTQDNLVGAGLVAGDSLIAKDPSLVRGFVQATLRGMQAVIDNPRAAFAVCKKVKGLQQVLTGKSGADQYAVLLKSISFWRSAGTQTHGLGYADPMQWQHSIATLRTVGQISRTLALSGVETEQFVAGAPKR